MDHVALRAWGNSQGIRIPKSIMNELDLKVCGCTYHEPRAVIKMAKYISKDKLMQYLEPKTNTPAIIIKRYVEDMPTANVLPIERGKYSDTIRRIELFISYYWSLDRDEEEEKDYVALKEALDVLKRINGEGEDRKD